MAPFAMFTVGYWAMSNRQIFFNDPGSDIEHANKAHDPNHDVLYFNETMNHSHFILIILLFLILDGFFGRQIHYLMRLLRIISNQHSDIDVDEGLDSYWRSIVGKE